MLRLMLCKIYNLQYPDLTVFFIWFLLFLPLKRTVGTKCSNGCEYKKTHCPRPVSLPYISFNS